VSTIAAKSSPGPDRVAALLASALFSPTKSVPSRKPADGLDALLVSGLSNVRYLSGFTGSNAFLVVSPSTTILITDPRYTLQAAREVPFPARIAKGPIAAPIGDLVRRKKWKRLGFERNRIGFEAWDALRLLVSDSCELVPVNGLVEEMRMSKSPDEIACIRQSVETNSRAFRRAMKGFRPGMRESELAAEIDYQSRRAGAEAPAFETIVASGPRSALPHARPTSAKIGETGILLIDMGAIENGYASDMTRTLHVGKASKRFKSLYQAVLEAQLAAIDAVRPGVTAGDIDRAARRVLESSGLGKQFVHSTGHGLGLEIHEGPRIGKKSKTVLQAGFVITVEPGVYFDGYGGIRIEDTVLVTESGAEVLTPTRKELVEW
jgi:Xaa-Pro aminopeptidase